MRVLRVEHLYCPTGKVHGPANGGDNCWNYDTKPYFGTRGPTPDADGGAPHSIQEHEICGVLPEQLDAWWSAWDEEKPRQLHARHGWVIAEYDVPDEDVVVLKWQVCFPRETARRVNAHYSAADFIPLRRPDLPPIHEDAYPHFK